MAVFIFEPPNGLFAVRLAFDYYFWTILTPLKGDRDCAAAFLAVFIGVV